MAVLQDPVFLAQCASCAFFAILFLQSGLDKAFDWKGNLDYLAGHFEKSPLKGMAKPMLGTITALEILAGLTAGVSFFSIIFSGPAWIPGLAIALAMLDLCCLFFGQRVAKDYAGAATLAAYFGVALVSALLFSIPA